ncbi:MAG: glycoside hydrolase [Chloroflexi bacterium]|nr:glycoside hydrolase [Chloroflexota bacterium]
MNEIEPSLQPAQLILSPGPEYADDQRCWQGIPGIERSPGGRLWATWYSGGAGEGPGNYVVLVTSAGVAQTWSGPQLVAQHPNPACRCYDPCPWCDPHGRLWLFWAQSQNWFDGRAGVWAIRCDDPDAAHPHWSSPRRLCHGVMMNKPLVLSTGEWCLPTAVWGSVEPHRPELAEERFSNLVVSTDAGASWTRRGGADVPKRAFDEHMVIERQDGSLWMLVRRHDGIGEAISTDRGITWLATPTAVLPGPNARFFIRRLRSRRLLLVNHARASTRSHLTAWLSGDDGRAWIGGLLLDERPGVSYPDGTEAPDGTLHLIYDYNRGDRWALGHDREILLALVREEDILAGQVVNPNSRLRVRVNQATG